MLIVIIIAFIIIAIMDLPALIKSKQRPDLIIYSVFFVSTLILAMLLLFGIAIPSPIKGAQYFIKDIFHLGYK